MSRMLHCLLLCSAATLALSAIVRREVPLGPEYDFHGLNSIEDFGHHAPHYHIPPAYSTISYIQTHHSKPTSYSGFTNHGRGHYDPGYAIEYRSEGFHAPGPYYGGHYH